MQPLPIDPLLPEVVRALVDHPLTLLEAPPGAGKTTRLPRALLDARAFPEGEILVLQPRRIAARMAARRVSEELGEEVGGLVGYQVRFDEVRSERTRVRFVTEGILTRRLLADRTLRGVACVLLDEFHERHLDGDLALALLQRLQNGERPDLRLGILSATLEVGALRERFPAAPLLRSEGRRFEVRIEHAASPEDRPVGSQVATALARLLQEGLDGDVLVFLPGAAEMRRTAEACASLAARHDLLVLPLHGDLSPAEQDRAVRPASKRKVVLATNVAETSLTIDGVVAVIDSGLARVAAHAPWSGLPTLRLERVSRASAAQRAGRAGRTRAGRCLRLYTRHDHDTRPAFQLPELARLDLSQLSLELRSFGLEPRTDLPWLEAPPPKALEAADLLLERLGAVDSKRKLTPVGRAMLRFPVHPRIARMLVEGEARGVSEEVVAMAALLSERDVRSAETRGRSARTHARSDLLELLELFEEARAQHGSGALAVGLEPGAVQTVERARKQLARGVRDAVPRPSQGAAHFEGELLKCVLAGFADRVAKVRTSSGPRGGVELHFAGGGTARLAESSVVRDETWVVALDAEERSERGATQVLVRLASGVDLDHLLELLLEQLEDRVVARFNAQTGRVDVERRLTLGSLVLEQTVVRDPSPEVLAPVLLEAALDAGGLRALCSEPEDLDRWLARARFARSHAPAAAFPALDAAWLEAQLAEACATRRTMADLRAVEWLAWCNDTLPPAAQRALAELAPDRVELPGGRKVKVEYGNEGGPWIASRLQDFFGMAKGPTVVAGRVPLVLHLLAPNGRAVQVSTDLAGFWDRHYPSIAKELRRQYPRHSWPEDPRTARPPEPRRR